VIAKRANCSTGHVRKVREELGRGGHRDPEDDPDCVGEDEPPAPDPIRSEVIDQRRHASLSFSGLRG